MKVSALRIHTAGSLGRLWHMYPNTEGAWATIPGGMTPAEPSASAATKPQEATPVAGVPTQALVLRGPSGSKQLTSSWQVGRAALGLANDQRISRKHLGFYVDRSSSGWAVEQLSANASWVRHDGDDFAAELERGATHRLKHGDTLWLVVQEDEMYTLHVALLDRALIDQPAAPATPATGLSAQAMDSTMVGLVQNPLAQGATVAMEPTSAARSPRQSSIGLALEASSSRIRGDELIDDMVIKEVAHINDGDIRFGEIFFEETRQVRPYLYVPKDVALEEVLPAVIACFQLKQPSSVLDVLPHRGAHDHYLRWSLDVLKDERARNTWRWRDESDTQVDQGNEESHQQQCMRQFGTQLVEAAAEVVKAVDESGGWFCSKAGRDASQQLLGHAIEEANSRDYVWLGVACTSRLCWSRQLRKCSRALNKRDGLGIKPEVKRRMRYPAMRTVFRDNAAKFDRDLELSLEQQDPSVPTRAQLQWSLIDPHISHLVVFEDPRVEDALRNWVTSEGINVDEGWQSIPSVDTPGLGSPRGADDTYVDRVLSLNPHSFLQSSTGASAVFLDYWRHVSPSERHFWRHLRESLQKLDVQVGCLLTNTGNDEVDWATQCAEAGLPVVVLEATGAVSIAKGIEGAEAAASTQADTQQDLDPEDDTVDVWKPTKKRGLSQRAAQLRVSLHATATGTAGSQHAAVDADLSSPRSPELAYRHLAFGIAKSVDIRNVKDPGPEHKHEHQVAGTARPFPLRALRTMPPPLRFSLPDDAVDDPRHAQPSTQKITIRKGPTGFGFAVSDSCVVTQVAGAAMEARVPLNSRIVGVAGHNVTSKAEIIGQLRLLGPDVSAIEFTFQMPGGDAQASAYRSLPPERPLVTAGNRRRTTMGPHVMARLVRVAVSDSIIYSSLVQRKQLREALQVSERADRNAEKKERSYDKQVVMATWNAYTTLRYNALTSKTRDDLLQTALQVMHVLVALTVCITVSLEVGLEGLQPVPVADIEAGTLSAWEPKNSMSGNMDDYWAPWVTHTLNFVGPCVLILILGLQAVWGDDGHWPGYLLRAERLRSAIYSYRGRVGEWSLPVVPRGGWWYEQLARTRPQSDSAAITESLSSIGASTRERNRERLHELQEDTLFAAMTRASNTAVQATVTVMCGAVLSAFGLVLLITGLYVELQYDDRPLALLLALCGVAAMATGFVVIRPLANQARKGRPMDMTPLKEPTAAFMQACAPPFEFDLPWNKGIRMGALPVPAPAGGGGGEIGDAAADGHQNPTDSVHASTVVAIDNGFASIGAEEYLQFRVYPLRAELGQLGPQLTVRLRQVERLLFLSSLASALCAIAAPVFQRHLAIWVCLFNTIGYSALFYSHRTSVREVACAANTTCVTLDACIDWWLTRPAKDKLRRETFERLVSDVERAVETLCVVWTSCALGLAEARNTDEDQKRQMMELTPQDRDLDAKLRKKIQPKAGKLML